MQKLAGYLVLPVALYGLGRDGWVGALTGAVAVFAIGSGLAIFIAESGTGVDEAGRIGSVQRLGGAVAAVASLAGVAYGGWRSGWLWAAAGYLLGIAVALVVGLLSGRLRSGA